jgi:CRP-like cAMP-binding protein
VIGASTNLLLASIGTGGGIINHLRTVELKQNQCLGDDVDVVYFPTEAIISIDAPLPSGETMEIVMVGSHGGVGVGAALDGRISRSRAVVLHPGEAVTCDASAFRHAVFSNDRLIRFMFQHAQDMFALAQQSALCVSTHQVENRLASWLLNVRTCSIGHVRHHARADSRLSSSPPNEHLACGLAVSITRADQVRSG